MGVPFFLQVFGCKPKFGQSKRAIAWLDHKKIFNVEKTDARKQHTKKNFPKCHVGCVPSMHVRIGSSCLFM